MNDDHLKRIRAEFERQSAPFDAYADRADTKMEERFRAALGDAGRGQILDVACGPGAVTVAVARGATRVVGLDTTPAMLERARRRAETAGLANVEFREGDAGNLPFEEGSFDAVITRASLHHFTEPAVAVREMFRVMRPGGRVVLVDVVSTDEPAESELHNALETLRDPTHVRMLPPGELNGLVTSAGFRDLETATWDAPREFGEWLAIVNDPSRTEPLRIVMRTIAETGNGAGMDLRIEDGEIRFLHRWHLVAANRP